jgi:holo-[acyl-carrier protein] synthase
VIVGIGVDVLEIERFRKVLERQGDRFVRRVFTPAEQAFCSSHSDPAPHYAVRFAAKEALFKALGTGWAKGVGWLDVEVIRSDREAPRVVLRGKAGEMSSSLKCRTVHISLSHSHESAIALVVLEA